MFPYPRIGAGADAHGAQTGLRSADPRLFGRNIGFSAADQASMPAAIRKFETDQGSGRLFQLTTTRRTFPSDLTPGSCRPPSAFGARGPSRRAV